MYLLVLPIRQALHLCQTIPYKILESENCVCIFKHRLYFPTPSNKYCQILDQNIGPYKKHFNACFQYQETRNIPALTVAYTMDKIRSIHPVIVLLHAGCLCKCYRICFYEFYLKNDSDYCKN